MTIPGNETALTGREYRRVSIDRSGRSRSPQEQGDDNARMAATYRVSLGVPYEDRDRSASRYATRVREDFDQLIVDLRTGQFGADVLVLWESSRGSRKVAEWVELIELLEQRGVKILVTTHNRMYDPGNPRDRRSLLEDAVDSEYESAKTSLRVRRDTAAAAGKGRPHGRPPFGYRRRYDPVTGVLAEQEIHPDEAPLVRELFDRLLKGHSLYAIAKDWHERGVRTRSGTVFLAPQLRNMALNEAYAGVRVHAAGRRGGNIAPAGAVRTEATWPALVSRAVFLSVRRLLMAPERKVSKPGRGVHLLSMIATCHVCGSVLHVQYYRGVPHYRCKAKGCCGAPEAALDAFVERKIVEFLARLDHTQFQEEDADNGELAAVRADLNEAHDLLDELAGEVAAKRMTARLAGQVERETLEKIEALEQRERELSTPDVLRGLIAPGADVAVRWKGAPMSTRRMVARIVLSPDWLGQVRVAPNGRGRRVVPVDQRVLFWRASTS